MAAFQCVSGAVHEYALNDREPVVERLPGDPRQALRVAERIGRPRVIGEDLDLAGRLQPSRVALGQTRRTRAWRRSRRGGR